MIEKATMKNMMAFLKPTRYPQIHSDYGLKVEKRNQFSISLFETPEHPLASNEQRVQHLIHSLCARRNQAYRSVL